MFSQGRGVAGFEDVMMGESTDRRGRAWLLCVALLAMAGSGCATLSDGGESSYARNMAAAEVALRADDVASALQAYQRAAEAVPAVMLPWLKIAETQAGQGDWAQAVAASREVLNREPDNADARGFYLEGSLQLAIDALGYLPDTTLAADDPAHESASALLAKLIDTLGDQAIPPETRKRWEAEIERGKHRPGRRSTPTRTNPKAQEKKEPEKPAVDPFDVLGGG